MDIKKIKKEMIAYRDLFGGDLLNVSDIDSAKSKEELAIIIDKHYDFLSDQCNDAQHSLSRFKNELGLNNLD